MAIKRIPDTLASPEQAKRVLREVAILRRLQHVHVIGLRDAFTRPSATGLPPATIPVTLRSGSMLEVYVHASTLKSLDVIIEPINVPGL